VDTWRKKNKKGECKEDGCIITHLDEQQSASVIFDKLTPYKVNTDAHSPEQPHDGNTAQHGKLS
jgi:hypothetical protein